LGCPECSGVFCGTTTLKELIRQARQTLSTEFYHRPKLPQAPAKYLRCPACDQLMDRHNFGVTSGVIVDVCVKDGVWFDNGELAQVLHFCSSEQFPDLDKLDKSLRQGRPDAKVIPLEFPDTSEKPLDQMSPRELALDVLSFLRFLIP
jgi:Zn-finger nucleic acid-binding protein